MSGTSKQTRKKSREMQRDVGEKTDTNVRVQCTVRGVDTNSV